jgi:hypothetical protein
VPTVCSPGVGGVWSRTLPAMTCTVCTPEPAEHSESSPR